MLHVALYSSKGKDRLLGRWLMTLKYLVTLPTNCKHKRASLALARDGSIAGTFLLCDRKLHV